MANVSTTERVTNTTSETEVSAATEPVVQQRLSRRSRLLLAHIGPLGWFLFDFAIAAFAAMLAFVLTPKDVGTLSNHVSPVLFAIEFAISLGIVAQIAGLHDARSQTQPDRIYMRVVSVVFVAMALLLVVLSALHFLKVGRYIVMITVFSCSWLMIVARITASHFAANYLQSVAFLGPDLFCFRGSQFVDSQEKPFRITSRTFDNSESNIAVWAVEQGIDEVIFDPFSLSDGDDERLLDCLDEGIKVSSYSDFVEEQYLMVPVEEIDANWIFSARLDLAHPYYHGVKRLIDMAASIIGLALTLPVILIAIVLIKLESRGPAIYSQIRTGRFDRPFRIYKLRTMVQNAETTGAQWASVGDSRITRLGRFLRRTRIDELPQFWNVLLGDMSLVGPRPERPQFVQMLKKEIPFYLQRHLVKPGLTGWAQINYRYGASVDDSKNKLMYDLYYVKRASLALDLQILLRTVGTMMKGSR